MCRGDREDTDELIRNSKDLRDDLVRLTARLDQFVQRLVATTDDTARDEENRGQVEG